MSLSRNLIAGIASSAWTALIGLAVVPVYIKYLGIGAYGLVGFLATLQSLFSLLDLGLSTTINRETARLAASGQLSKSASLLHTLAMIYWSIAAIIAMLTAFAAPVIARYWLQSNDLPHHTITHAVMLMGLIAAARWPIALYQGALLGAQRLTISSVINVVMTTLGSLGAIGILAFVSPTIQALFFWQACIGLLYALTMRWAAWRVIGEKSNRFDVAALKQIWHFSLGISAITITALVFMQLDKIILSKTLKLEDFGRYMLATTIVSALYMIIMPVYNTVYPRFTGLVSTKEEDKLAALYRLGTRILASVLFPIATTLAIFANDLVSIWTGNSELAREVAPLVGLLAIGAALHGVMFFPYSVQLAYGRTGLSIRINAILMVVQLPLVIALSLSYGALGGAISWLVLQVLYVLLGTWITHLNLLQGIGKKWLLSDVGMPLTLSIPCACLDYYIDGLTGFPIYMKLIAGIFSGLLTIFCAVAIFPDIRSMLQAIRLRIFKSAIDR